MKTKISDLHKVIKDSRNLSNMTQRSLANVIGVTPQAVGQWEKPVDDGGVLPGLKRIPQLERALGVNFGMIELLIDDEHSSNAPRTISSPTSNNTIPERRIALIEAVLRSDGDTIRLMETLVRADADTLKLLETLASRVKR